MSGISCQDDSLSKSKPAWLRRTLFLFSVAFSGYLLHLAIRDTQWAQIAPVLGRCSVPWLLATNALILLSFYCRGVRWAITLVRSPPRPNLAAFSGIMAGLLGNYYLPARAGEVIRCLLLGKALRTTKTGVLATILAERLFDVLFLAVLGAVSLTSLAAIFPALRPVVATVAAAGAFGVVLICLAVAGRGTVQRLIVSLPLPERVREKIRDVAERFLLGLKSLGNAKLLLEYTFWSAAIWLLDIGAMLTIGLTLGLPLSFAIGTVLLVCMAFASALPSAPGFIGIYQIVAVQVLVPFGYSPSEALAFSLVFHLIHYLQITVLGLAGVVHLGRLAS